MSIFIGRAHSEPRIFIFGHNGPYKAVTDQGSLTSDQLAARAVINLSFSPLKPRQKFFGAGLQPIHLVSRLLFLHRKALESEQQSQWNRADFYWREFYLKLPRTIDSAEVWKDLAEFCAKYGDQVTEMSNPNQIKQRLVDEVFIDTHCAFHNSLSQDQSSRVHTHQQYLQQLIRHSASASDDFFTLYGAALNATAMQDTKGLPLIEIDNAVHACRELLSRVPDSLLHQDQLAKLLLARHTTALLNGKTAASFERDAETLRMANKEMDTILQQFPENDELHHVQGLLYYLRAIKLANCGRVSDALVNIQKAFVYFPGSNEVRQATQDLINVMKRYQQNWNAISVRLRGNQRLTAQGQKLRTEALRGFLPMKTFVESAEYKKIEIQRTIAQQRSLWRRLELPVPPNDWDEIARLLVINISQILIKPPPDPDSIRSYWTAAVAGTPRLAGINPDPIYTYLSQRLFGKPAIQRKDPMPGIPERQALKIKMVSRSIRMLKEPFMDWLFSKQDMRVKIQFTTVLSLMLMTGLWIASMAISPRIASYNQFVIAALQKSPQAIIQRVESHNLQWPLNCSNPQDAQMSQWYQDAYYDLIDSAYQEGDTTHALEWSEAYLSNTSARCDELADQPIRQIYDETFVRWFIKEHGNLDDAAAQHIRRYQSLLEP